MRTNQGVSLAWCVYQIIALQQYLFFEVVSFVLFNYGHRVGGFRHGTDTTVFWSDFLCLVFSRVSWRICHRHKFYIMLSLAVASEEYTEHKPLNATGQQSKVSISSIQHYQTSLGQCAIVFWLSKIYGSGEESTLYIANNEVGVATASGTVKQYFKSQHLRSLRCLKSDQHVGHQVISRHALTILSNQSLDIG